MKSSKQWNNTGNSTFPLMNGNPNETGQQVVFGRRIQCLQWCTYLTTNEYRKKTSIHALQTHISAHLSHSG